MSRKEIVQTCQEEIEKLGKELGVEFIKKEKMYTTENPKEDAEKIAKANEIYNKSIKDGLVLYANLSEQAQIALYNFVGVLLGIPDDMLAHLTSFSVLEILAATLQKYPEFFNEADAVFGL